MYALKSRPRRTGHRVVTAAPGRVRRIVYGMAAAAGQTMMIHANPQAPGPRRFTIMEIAAASPRSYNNIVNTIGSINMLRISQYIVGCYYTASSSSSSSSTCLIIRLRSSILYEYRRTHPVIVLSAE